MESGFAGFKWTVCPAAYVQVACSRIDSCPEIARVFIQSEHGNFRSHSFCGRETTGMVQKHRENNKS